METIEIHVPREGVGRELTRALAAQGLDARFVEDGDRCALEVAFADPERDRLLLAATHAVETWLAEQESPLVVQHADGVCVVRPPGD